MRRRVLTTTLHVCLCTLYLPLHILPCSDHAVWQYVYHEDYDDWTSSNDVALLFLDQDLSADARLSVVSVPELSVGEACCSQGDELQVIGYGLDESNGVPTDTLEYSTQKYVSLDECNARYNTWRLNGSINDSLIDWVDGTMLCSIGNDTDSCQGDSGGPLMYVHNWLTAHFCILLMLMV